MEFQRSNNEVTNEIVLSLCLSYTERVITPFVSFPLVRKEFHEQICGQRQKLLVVDKKKDI